MKYNSDDDNMDVGVPTPQQAPQPQLSMPSPMSMPPALGLGGVGGLVGLIYKFRFVIVLMVIIIITGVVTTTVLRNSDDDDGFEEKKSSSKKVNNTEKVAQSVMDTFYARRIVSSGVKFEASKPFGVKNAFYLSVFDRGVSYDLLIIPTKDGTPEVFVPSSHAKRFSQFIQ